MATDRCDGLGTRTIHQNAWSPSGGAARALELSSGIHSRSSNFPKRADPPPKVLNHDPGTMWRPETSFGATRFRLPHPTKGFALNRQTYNADLNVTQPSFDTSKYQSFTYGKYHGVHMRKEIGQVTLLPPQPRVQECTSSAISVRSPAAPNAAQREAATCLRRNQQNAMCHSQAKLPADYSPSDSHSIPYLREAQMTKELYDVFQSLKEQEDFEETEGIGRGVADFKPERQNSSSIIPAVKLRRANDFRRSVIKLVEPVEVPFHNAFHLRTVTAATDARLRRMYTTDHETEPLECPWFHGCHSESRSVIDSQSTRFAKHRDLTGGSHRAPLYWLPAKARTARCGIVTS